VDDSGTSIVIGDRVRIRETYAPQAGNYGHIEGCDETDQTITVKMEKGNTKVCLSALHLELADGSGRCLGAVPAPVLPVSFEMPKGIDVQIGERVRLVGAACPAHLQGKVAYVEIKDVGGEDAGLARVRTEGTYTYHDGFISSGGTFLKERMTVEEAQKKCTGMRGVGFTFDTSTLGPDGRALVYLKNRWDINGPGKGWSSYKLEEGSYKSVIVHPAHLERA
jgi:hypothetical protein